MGYEKKYKEALERAREALNDGTISSNTIAYLQDIFPELKESEDERIRNEIIEYLKGERNAFPRESDDFQTWIAWLEKKESVGEIVSRCKTSWYNEGKIQGQIEGLSNEEKYQQGWHDALEKQGKSAQEAINEEKVDNANKVEPKFKVGDWVILTAGELSTTLQIANVDINKKLYWFNDSSYLPIVDEECLHHWTIQDAKDGDVLACNEEILLFKSYSVQGRISLYCWCNGHTNNFHSKEEVDTLMTTKNKICPATKEQRDLLFQEIKEAGYEWDAEKKELKLLITNGGDFFESENCEQKPTDEEIKELLRTEYEKGRADAIAEMQKSSWSIEDERICNNIICDIANDKSICKYEISKRICDEQIT